MTIEEIRKGAPKTASHYMIHNGELYYLRWSKLIGGWVCKHNDIWVDILISRKDEIKPLSEV